MTESQQKFENLPALLAKSPGTDLHWFTEDAGLTDLAETLVAMANGSGGRVILGVSPRGSHLQGVSNPEALVDLVFQACLLAEPVLVLPVPLKQAMGGKTALIVTVPEGLPHAYNLGGRYLARKGSQNASIPARQLRELLVARGVLQFESRLPADATLDDLDLGQIKAYLAEINRPDADWQQTLLQRGCLAAVGDKLRPTYAALLLFGKYPQRWLPNATILAARFPGISFSDEFLRQDIAGTLPQQLRQAELFLQDNLRMVVRMVGLTHQDTPEYPYSAVRELLVNAVAHR
ncbi:MAG: helix-turn-helix domain-containing protein, partial [Anaerolineales bacterium]